MVVPTADPKVRPKADRWVCPMAVPRAYRKVGLTDAQKAGQKGNQKAVLMAVLMVVLMVYQRVG